LDHLLKVIQFLILYIEGVETLRNPLIREEPGWCGNSRSVYIIEQTGKWKAITWNVNL